LLSISRTHELIPRGVYRVGRHDRLDIFIKHCVKLFLPLEFEIDTQYQIMNGFDADSGSDKQGKAEEGWAYVWLFSIRALSIW